MQNAALIAAAAFDDALVVAALKLVEATRRDFLPRKLFDDDALVPRTFSVDEIDARSRVAHDEVDAGALERLASVDHVVRARRFLIGDGI